MNGSAIDHYAADPQVSWTLSTPYTRRMAVADVAVAMGPRNQRRVRNAALAAVVVIALLGLGFFLTHHSSSGSGAASKAARQGASISRATHLVYGMTPQQVQHFAGRAQSVRGGCWYYMPMLAKDGATRVGALTVGFPGTPSMSSNQIKLCFYSGVLSFEYTHVIVPGKGREWVQTKF
ncbi:MAG TPA: hypothetical protein VLJ44_09055 [Gaiellaceae bacterium]|nr:hypothetical protein [Gaiellaceae bacterium]